jgi:UDP-glucose 4-epimerase
MNILVTGGAGFIGTNLIKKLLEENHTIVSVDNYSTGKVENHQEGCEYHNYDINNIEDYSWLGKFDIIYHLAAIARIQPSFERPSEYFETNANATMKICHYASKNNIPLVYAGSSSHHSGKFKNPYTFSKDTGEEVVKLFQEHYNLKASIARFYNVYGPYHLKEGGYCTLIGTWERSIEQGMSLTVYGDGSKRRDFTHVEDIVDALIRIGDQNAWGYTFELGRGKNYSVLEIALMFDKATLSFAADKPGEAQETLCTDFTAQQLLQWQPKWNIQDYIKQYNNGKSA